MINNNYTDFNDTEVLIKGLQTIKDIGDENTDSPVYKHESNWLQYELEVRGRETIIDDVLEIRQTA